jgi:hypothetical protein
LNTTEVKRSQNCLSTDGIGWLAIPFPFISFLFVCLVGIRYRVEEVSIVELCETIEAAIQSVGMCTGLVRMKEAEVERKLKWVDLQDADSHLAGKAMAMARRFGYTI